VYCDSVFVLVLMF